MDEIRPHPGPLQGRGRCYANGLSKNVRKIELLKKTNIN